VSDANNPIEFRLEFSNDPKQPYMWRVYKKGGTTKLAYSETYATRQGPINAVAVVKAGNCTYEVFQGSDKKWYFHIEGKNHEILARSAYKYDTEAAATAAKDLIQRNAASAPFYDYAKAA
jgi:uncharacterized protein YegP (UPF0339 family)